MARFVLEKNRIKKGTSYNSKTLSFPNEKCGSSYGLRDHDIENVLNENEDCFELRGR